MKFQGEEMRNNERFPVKIDWLLVITRLRKELKNYEGIAEATGVAKSNISYIGSGHVKNPGYLFSAKILNTYVEVYGDTIPLL